METDTTATSPQCIVADTSAPGPDIVYTVGIPPADSARATPLDCTGKPITDAMRPATLDLPSTGLDVRDMLDSGHGGRRPDVLVTRDPDLIQFAMQGDAYFTVPLPWDRTYVLATPGSWPGPITAAERDALARDAVRGAVRGAAEGQALRRWGCWPRITTAAATRRQVIAYIEGDDIARQLAERVAALAGNASRPTWIAPSVASARNLRLVAMPALALKDALTAGRIMAAVVGTDRSRGVPCDPLVPLVDSRAHAIVRRGSGVSFIIGADGALWFTRRGAP